MSYPIVSSTATLAVREDGPARAVKPRLLDQVREAIRTRRYSRRTEKAYVHWIKRYILFHHGEPVVMAGGTGFGYRAFSVRSSSSGVSVIALSNHMTTDVRASAFAILDGVLGFG